MDDFGGQKERVARRVKEALFGVTEGVEDGTTLEDTHALLKADTRAMKTGKGPIMETAEVAALWSTFPKTARKWLKENQKLHGGVN